MRSLGRVLAILEAVAAEGSAASAKVAGEVGLAPSTVSRVMREMSDEHVLWRNPDGTYEIGERLFLLVNKARPRVSALSRISSILARLRDESGETVSLHIVRGGYRVCVACEESRHAVRRVVPVGESLPLLPSATGEILLLGLSAEERASIISKAEMPLAEQRKLETRLRSLSKRPWEIVIDKWMPHVTGICAAVFDEDRVAAALTITGPSSRFTEAAALAHVEDLLAAAAEIGSHQESGWWY
jgi:DNA-binding IclR family transcriptional regulator